MRVFIRNNQTGKFFRTHRRWVENPKDAFDFEECEGVIYAVTEFGLEDAEMVMMDDDGKQMFSIDLSRKEGALRVFRQKAGKKSSLRTLKDF